MNIFSGIEPFSMIDYPGKISSVIFTQGCDLSCHYCQNSKLRENTEGILPNNEIYDFIKSRSNYVEAIVFSGGEPTKHIEILDFIKYSKSLDLYVGLHTSGYNYENLKKIAPYCDWIGFDLKAPHYKYGIIAGCPPTFPYKSLDWIFNNIRKIEIRTTYSNKLTKYDYMSMAIFLNQYYEINWCLQTCYSKPYENGYRFPNTIDTELYSYLESIFCGNLYRR